MRQKNWYCLVSEVVTKTGKRSKRYYNPFVGRSYRKPSPSVLMTRSRARAEKARMEALYHKVYKVVKFTGQLELGL